MDRLLIWLLVVPLAGAVVGALLKGPNLPRAWALGVSLLTAALAAVLVGRFDFADSAAIQFAVSPDFMKLDSIGASLSLGVDAISLWLVALTALLMPLAIAASWLSIGQRRTEYYAWMLLLLFAMLGVFVARDLLLFYICFELTLIPMFFIIGIWGGAERQFAAGKFFLFTFAGSVFTLVGVIYLGLTANSFDINAVIQTAQNSVTPAARFWIFLSMLVGFAVKVPLFPVHTWLPLAHTEAPTAGSVILAGVLLKLGSYGLLRLALPVGSNDVVYQLAGVLGVLCLVGIVYGALVAWVQKDIKKLVAYSSVSHMGFCILGLVALNMIGAQGSVLYMINHGITTGALFLMVGMVYDRYHTRDIERLSGLARRMPKLAFFFILFTLASIGLPGTNGFVSEFLTILGAFTSTSLGMGYGAVAALGIILGAVYMLRLAGCVIFGPLKTPADSPDAHGEQGHDVPGDIGGREIAILLPLAVLVIVLGVMPNIVLKSIEAPLAKILPQAPQPAALVMNPK